MNSGQAKGERSSFEQKPWRRIFMMDRKYRFEKSIKFIGKIFSVLILITPATLLAQTATPKSTTTIEQKRVITTTPQKILIPSASTPSPAQILPSNVLESARKYEILKSGMTKMMTMQSEIATAVFQNWMNGDYSKDGYLKAEGKFFTEEEMDLLRDFMLTICRPRYTGFFYMLRNIMAARAQDKVALTMDTIARNPEIGANHKLLYHAVLGDAQQKGLEFNVNDAEFFQSVLLPAWVQISAGVNFMELMQSIQPVQQ
jgi:hypothetical protein